MVSFAEFKTWFWPKLAISYTFIAAGLVINVIQLLTFLLVRPFNRILYKRINCWLGYFLFSNMIAIANYWSGMELDVYASDEDFKALGKENCYCVANHKYDIDWLIGWTFCQRVGLLGGAKVVLKDPLKYIPVIGWAWSFCEYIFVKRVWEKDQQSLVRDLNSILEYPDDLKYAIIIFCESTRFTKEKHEASLEVAKQKGLPILKHHLLPRPKGFRHVASQLNGKVDYLYDITFAAKDIDGRLPSLADVQRGVSVKAQIYFRRIPMSQVPVNDEKQCAQFLNKVYQEKDEIFDAFHTNGDFSSLGVKKQPTPKNGHDLIIGLLSLTLVLLPSVYYFLVAFWNGTLLFKFIVVLFVPTLNFLINWMIDRSNVQKTGSNFGLKTQQQSASSGNDSTIASKKLE